MAQRYQSGIVAISQAATTVVHNLSGGTPTEYQATLHGLTNVYFIGVSQTNVVLAAGAGAGAACNANIFASIPHSVIQ